MIYCMFGSLYVFQGRRPETIKKLLVLGIKQTMRLYGSVLRDFPFTE